MLYSNPRRLAEFDNWPSGGKTVKCKFVVEQNSKGERVSKTTTDKSGRWCKPKNNVYGKRACIVDGEDGRTYIIQETLNGGVAVFQHDFMNPEYVFQSNPERALYLTKLLDEAK